MIKVIKRIFMFLIIVGIISGGIYLYFNTDLLRIQDVQFNENEHMDLYDIMRYSGVQKGTPYFEVDTDVAANNLMSHPYVRYATATKQFPNTVIFDVVYRKHFFNIRYSDIVLSLDDQLHVLEVLASENEGFTVEGFAFDSFSTGNVIDVSQLYILENIVDLLKLVQQSELECNPLILFKDRNIVLTIDQIKIKFGVGENIESKYNAFINIYEALKNDGIKNGIIDVSSDGLPVYRPFGE
ncbi:FtsQ-type POTRA domain-containing protein [Fusibacter bizertensis]|uniref:FtsQ-type POTRA domain-containing protein n=2 Tax=Fusibacter bizertensis TaxID=1488331 RepID=A0ABT6N8G7_9FIRM|nr:FtsQ-type POTRA domain-containing protein [Fusibacter bizertensis]